MAVLVYAKHAAAALNDAAAKAGTAAKGVAGGESHALVAGAALARVAKALHAEAPGHEAIVFPGTTTGKL